MIGKVNVSEDKLPLTINTICLGLYFLLAPLDPIPVYNGVSVTKVLAGITIATFILRIKHLRFSINKFYVFPILFLTYNLITIFFSKNPSESIGRIISLSLLLTTLLVCTLVEYNNREVTFLYRMAVLSGWITVLLLIFAQQEVGGRATISLNGGSQDQNTLVGFMILTVVYYFDKLISQRKMRYIVYLGCFLYCLLLTGSRGGFLAIIGALLFYLLLYIYEKKVNLKNIVITIVVLILFLKIFQLIMSFMPYDIQERYSIKYTMEDQGAHRFTFWNELFYIFSSSNIPHKFFGYGAGTIKDVAGFVAHNLWIETLIELGLIGLVVMVIFYSTYLIETIRKKKKVLSAVFIGYMILTFSLSLTTFKPIWNLMILILIIRKKEDISNNFH